MERNYELEIDRLKMLNDIYKNEDEQMKLEYTLMTHNYQKLLIEYQNLLEEHQNLVNRLSKNIVVRIYRKLKKIVKRN